MARCNDCNKFVSYGDPEFNVDFNHEVRDGEVTLSGSIEMTLTCGDCGGALKSTSLDFEETFSFDLPEGVTLPDDADINVEENDPEPTDRSEGKGRYAKRFYGAQLEGDVTVTLMVKDADGEEKEKEFTHAYSITVDQQASGFDDA